jgi:DNA repair protein SbcD/Mre11
MLIAHLADLHLGFRAYHRVTPRGVNAREADVAQAFREAIERVIALRPDLVLIAGDVFHTVRPSNASIAEAFRQFASLSARLPDVPVVMIAGNHDSPRSAETGNILMLFREIPGVYVVTEEAERVTLPGLSTSVFCIPHNALARSESIEVAPDPGAAVNVLMLHGTVTGPRSEAKIRHVTEFGGGTIGDEVIAPERWDYVALGHYHVATALAPNMWYAGATERTSANIWGERGPKGFVAYDTAARRGRFEPIPGREVIDLDWIAGRGRAAAEVDEAIARAVATIEGGIRDKVVRLVVTDLPRDVARALDHRRIREHRSAALHFHLDLRPPREGAGFVGSGASTARVSLREHVESFLSRDWPTSSPEVRRDRLVALGREYLEAAGGEEEEAIGTLGEGP